MKLNLDSMTTFAVQTHDINIFCCATMLATASRMCSMFSAVRMSCYSVSLNSIFKHTEKIRNEHLGYLRGHTLYIYHCSVEVSCLWTNKRSRLEPATSLTDHPPIYQLNILIARHILTLPSSTATKLHLHTSRKERDNVHNRRYPTCLWP